MSVSLPHLYYPFNSVINPLVTPADEHVIHWLQTLKPAPSSKWLEYYKKAGFTWFTARCFPDVGYKRLYLAADFSAWLFLLDDKCDEVSVGDKYHHIQQLAAVLTTVFAGYPQAGDEVTNPIVAALLDIWKRLQPISSLEWQERFIKCILRYLDACKLEASLMDLQQWPTVAFYVKHRPYLGAVHLVPNLAEVIEEIHLPEDVRAHPHIEAITLLCCNIVCWSNDLFSLDKELQNGDNHNLVLVLQHEHGLTLKEAVREAAAIHDGDMRRFVELIRQLPDFGNAINVQLNRYVSSLQSIISANMEWSTTDSKRYQFVFENGVLES